MIFFIIMGTLCISLHVNAECKPYEKDRRQTDLILPYGIVCIESGCWSRVHYWETDIFEVGFDQIALGRPREINVRILLNKIYYVEIKILSYKEWRTVKIILSECLHIDETCSENRRFTHNDVDIHRHQTYVAIGFRKDKKMNFVAVTKSFARATNHFGPGNVYEFKMPGFYFKTDEKMKISIESVVDRYYKDAGVAMHLSTSVGGFFFNADGYLIHDSCACEYYDNPNEKEGIAYIIKEYFNNSENWKAPPVRWTPTATVPYLNEKGMQIEPDEFFVKEAPNPNFDAKKMIRKGCKYVDAPKSTLPGEGGGGK